VLPACLPVPQPSLTGTGAKVAIICNVTPASSQSDETWNTLRFADGAKRIKVRVRRQSTIECCSRAVCGAGCMYLCWCRCSLWAGNTGVAARRLTAAVPATGAAAAAVVGGVVQVTAVKNEALDIAAVVAQYQREVAALKAQLAALSGEP
jgi:hypothetical protein